MSSFTKSDSGGGGCRVSTAVGFLLTLVAVLLAVGVGLIVHFAEKDKQEVVCRCELTNGGIGAGAVAGAQSDAGLALMQQCTNVIVNGGCEAQEVCNHCLPDHCHGGATNASSPTTDQQSEASPNMRLPDHTIPIHYDVELQPYMYSGNPEDFSYKGKVKMVVECKKAASNVTVHIELITVKRETMRFYAQTPGTSDPTVLDLETDEVRQFLILHLSGDMQVGHRYVWEMEYSGPMPDDLRGVYYSTYTRQGETKYMLTTQFQPTDARRAFPCYDEPAMKATFNITLVRPDNLISISNMPIMDSSQSFTENGILFVKDVYQMTPKMSTYLLAFVISDFEHTSSVSATGIEYRAFAIPESVNQTLYALDVGVKLIDEYQHYFQIPYPLPKQDMIAIPDFSAGAMENWGLITYRQTAMLYKPGVSAQKNQERVAVVVAHELAHMWFGDLVTPAWWDDLWLNEGFASYTEYLGVDFVHPDWHMLDKFVVLDTQRAMAFDGKVNTHPVIVVVNTPDEIMSIFDAISYSKGASIIRMMKHFLGEDTFKNGITNYLNSLKYDAAHHTVLWESLTQQAKDDGKGHMDVKDIMDTWTQQMNYPVVTVACDVMSPGNVKVTQERFLEDPTAVDPGTYTSPFGYRWTIPLTFTSSRDPNFNQTDTDVHWMTKDQSSMTVDLGVMNTPDCNDPSDWLLANTHQMGFYRVNYPHSNWIALSNQLKSNHKVIPVTNRAQIINDAFNLVKAGRLDLGTAMQTVDYLNNENDYVAWYAASSELEFISKMVSMDSLNGPFRNFMHSKLSDLFDSIGLDNTGASHREIDARRIIADQACGYGVQSCRDAASALFKQWMDDPDNNPIDVNLKPVVYCSAVSNGGWEEWNFALQMYKTVTVASEQRDLQSAMSCSEEPWILQSYLDLTIQPDSPIRKQDFVYALEEVGASTVGRRIVWDWFRTHFDMLAKDYISGSFNMGRAATGATRNLHTELELKELEQFISEKADLLGSGQRAFQQTLERTRTNIRWRQKNLPTLKEFLDQAGFGPDGNNDASSSSTYVDMRIPTHMSPEHYDVELQPYMYSGNPEDFSYKGKVKIIMRCNRASNNVTLHIDLIQVDPATIRFYGVSPLNRDPFYLNYEMDDVRQFIILKLSTNMVVGRHYAVEMSYSGKMPDDLRGVYYSQYTRNGVDKYMLTTQFQPTDARRAFPCFDEPAFKATFNITLVRPDYLISLSNMPIVDSSTSFVEGNITFVKDVYRETPKISTYLLAFVICDFTYLSSNTTYGVEYRAYAIPEVVSQARHALDVGVQLLPKYEDFFNIKYPLPKQDMIAIPDYQAGAMENWGLITYRETAMLYEEGVSSESDKEWVSIVVAHELAHMWFGDLVTPAWWDDLWLNEGFASFVEFLGVDMVFPEWNMFDKFTVSSLQRAMDYDGRVTSHPVIVKVNTPAEINEIFDVISYEKSASLIRMMRHFLGPQVFNTGVTNYLRSLEYEAATHRDLWAALTAEAQNNSLNYDVGSIMDTWTKQMNYPVVMVERDSNNPNHINVRQERYLVDMSAEDPGTYSSPYGYKWTIPLTITSSQSMKFDHTEDDIVWLMKEEESKSLNMANLPMLSDTNGWILANVKQIGYYRVNYGQSNWMALANQLYRNHKGIPISNRAQMLDDAFNLAKSGHIGLDTALNMTNYLGFERDYVPWSAAAGEMSYIKRMLSLDSLYAPFQSFMLDKLEPSYNHYGLDNTNASHTEIAARGTIAGQACSYGISACLDAASTQFKQWMDHPETNPIDVNLKDVVYCNAIRNGGWEEWQFALNVYKTTQVASERDRLYLALTCASKPWILKYFLDLTLEDDSPIRFQDMDYVIIYISYETTGRPLVWDFLRERFSDLEKKFETNPSSLARIIERATRNFNTQFQLQELETFLSTTARKLASTQAGTQRAVAQVKANVKWMDKNRPVLESFLRRAGFMN